MTQVIFVPELDEEFEFPDEATDDEIKGFISNASKNDSENLSKEEIVKQIITGKPIKDISETFNHGKLDKQSLGNLITAGQIGVGFLPQLRGAKVARVAVPAVVEGVGEFVQSQLKGDTVKESLGKSIKSGTLSGLVDATLGFSATKILKAGARKKFSKEISNMISKNPELATEPAESLNEISKRGTQSIKNLRESKGSLVGKAKAKVKEVNPKVDSDPVLESIESGKREIGLIADQGEEVVVDRGGTKALDLVEELLTKPGKQDFKTVNARLKTIDNSSFFKRINTNKLDPKKRLSEGEALALRARGELNSILNQSTEKVAIGANLPGAKKGFHELLTVLTTPTIQSIQGGSDNLASLIKRSTGEARGEVLGNLMFIDDLLPNKEKFLKKGLSTQVGSALGKLSGTDITGKIKGSIISGLSEKGAKQLVKPSVRTAIRRGVSEFSNDPEEARETVGSTLSSGISSGVEGFGTAKKSLNEIIHGNAQVNQ